MPYHSVFALRHEMTSVETYIHSEHSGYYLLNIAHVIYCILVPILYSVMLKVVRNIKVTSYKS